MEPASASAPSPSVLMVDDQPIVGEAIRRALVGGFDAPFH
jgi:hypothetical protein